MAFLERFASASYSFLYICTYMDKRELREISKRERIFYIISISIDRILEFIQKSRSYKMKTLRETLSYYKEDFLNSSLKFTIIYTIFLR